MTDTVAIELVESAARRVTWFAHPSGNKKAVYDCSGASRIWISAEHAETGTTKIINIPNELPSNFSLGKISALLTRNDILGTLGEWKFALSMLLSDEDIPLVVGTITVVDRANDPAAVSNITGTGAVSSGPSAVLN